MTTPSTTTVLTEEQKNARLVAAALTALSEHIIAHRLPMPLSIESTRTNPAPRLHIHGAQVDEWVESLEVTGQHVDLGYSLTRDAWHAECRLPATSHVVHLVHLVPTARPHLQAVSS